MPSFSPQDILAITRRMVKIPRENAGLQLSINASTSAATNLLQVDNANAQFWNEYHTIATSYETEALNINGTTSPTYNSTDVDNSAKVADGNIFFPYPDAPLYQNMVPKVIAKSKGFFNPGAVNPLNETDLIVALTSYINYLDTGTAAGSTQSSTGTYPGVLVTNIQMNVGDCYLQSGGYSGRYHIVSSTLNGGTYDNVLTSVFPSTVSLSNPTIYQSVAAFTPTERQTLVSATFQEYLTNLTNAISSSVTSWQSYLNNQYNALNVNTDNRTTPKSNNLLAKSAAAAALIIVNSWLSLSNTGVNGRFIALNLAPISALMVTRTSSFATRISQITTALGVDNSCLTQSGETYASSDPTSPYYKRQSWLDKRINRVYGSLSRYYASLNAGQSATTLQTNNTDLMNEYSSYFVTKAMVANDGSNILQLSDNTNLSISDTVHIVSETLPTINATILAKYGTTQVKISVAIPVTYTVDDIARLYKVL